MQKYLSELSRSRPYREAPDNFSELVSVLIRSAERERAGLKRAIEGLLKTAEVIPLDTDMLYRAGSVQFALDMSAQDSIVLASVIHHLQETDPPESCFSEPEHKGF